jgi:serine/threonine protein phosphatase PrpC
VGLVRQHNEDACLDRPDLGLWVVADGMGGHAAGDVASGMIVERLNALEPTPQLSRFLEQVEETLERVNRDLRRLAASHAAVTIGSTVAALLVRDAHAVCTWAGDSRIYRLRDGELVQITRDHALVADLLDRGMLTAEQAAKHPQSNLVTRAVGAGDSLKLDCEIVALHPGDRFILCSDGLDKEVDDEELRSAASENVADLAHALVELALSRGSRDNVTVVVVDIEHGDASLAASAPQEDADGEDTVPGFTTGLGAGDGTVPGTSQNE